MTLEVNTIEVKHF